MRVMPDEEFHALLEIQHETERIEWKEPFAWDDEKSKWLQEKVIQAILGLANTRGGGYIIIGIVEDKTHGRIDFCGLDVDKLSTYEDWDAIKGKVDSFASPSVIFDISKGVYQGNDYVIIHVIQFASIPIVCKKNGDKYSSSQNTEYRLLEDGAIYCRRKSGPPATTKVKEIEIREILDRAVDLQQEQLKHRGWQHRDNKVDKE